jgi:hypothetical protein
MTRLRALAAILAAGAVSGCAAPQLTAPDLAARAQRNMIEAQQEFAGRKVIVNGVVQTTTLVTRGQLIIGAGPYYAPATVSTRQDQIPVVVLQPGSVFCYLEPFDIEDAAHLKPGDAVSLQCHVDSFRPGSPAPVSVLSTCRNSDRW